MLHYGCAHSEEWKGDTMTLFGESLNFYIIYGGLYLFLGVMFFLVLTAKKKKK